MRWISDSMIDRLRTITSLPDLGTSDYELLDTIGRGGMGVVYVARDPKLGRRVALKLLDVADGSGDLAERLVREARILARLEHPGIVPVHDVGVLEDGRVFYTMKLVLGQRLDEYLRDRPALVERLRVFLRICEAVAFAHDRGVLHRDLKPANVMVGAFGEVLVMDWGVAKVLGAPLAGGGVPDGGAVSFPAAGEGATEVGSVIGTPGYMAPEQSRGEVDRLDERADVYALGAVLAAMLSGEADSEATTLTLPERRWPARSGPHAKLSRRLAAVIDKAMAPQREDRYTRVEDLAADVGRFLEGGSVAALPESVWTRWARFLSRHRVAVALILVYVIVRTLVLLLAGR